MASSKKRSKKQRSCKPYPFDLRLRAVKLYLEEGYSKKLIEEELGIGNSTIGKWATQDFRSFKAVLFYQGQS